jgi:bifunctional enzyme CysN/CysC
MKKTHTIDAFLGKEAQQGKLRLIICGSVDSGKSTLIGRPLWKSQHFFEGKQTSPHSESKEHYTQGSEWDLDITTNVAYRFLTPPECKILVAHPLSHEQYTGKVFTGASTADMAILLVDARTGLLTQTRRHAYLLSLVGIQHVSLAVNKMDLMGYSEATFKHIIDDFEQFAQPLGFQSITPIPLSALKGDNITEHSGHTPWYHGPTLMGLLENIQIEAPKSNRLVFPVQWLNRPNADVCGFSGIVVEGKVNVGDEIRITTSGQTAKVSKILTIDGNQATAHSADAITLFLDQEVGASRGDILSLTQKPLETTDQFEATLIWMHEDAGLAGRTYDLKLANQWAAASITQIKHRVDINTLAHEATHQLQFNDIAVCNIATARPVVFDTYKGSQILGGFILVDRFTHATVAAGLINHTLRRAQNIHKHAHSITVQDRERLNGHAGKVIWFTGLSGSGKSTLASALEVELHAQGIRTYILDGDNVRHGLNKDLGFSAADRVENIRRIAEVAKLMADAGLVVMTAFISPFRHEREMARELIGSHKFIEVYVSTPVDVCEERDVKGLYKQARAGKIPNMTGINSPYEPPDNPDFVANTASADLKEITRDLLNLFSNGSLFNQEIKN